MWRELSPEEQAVQRFNTLVADLTELGRSLESVEGLNEGALDKLEEALRGVKDKRAKEMWLRLFKQRGWALEGGIWDALKQKYADDLTDAKGNQGRGLTADGGGVPDADMV